MALLRVVCTGKGATLMLHVFLNFYGNGGPFTQI